MHTAAADTGHHGCVSLTFQILSFALRLNRFVVGCLAGDSMLQTPLAAHYCWILRKTFCSGRYYIFQNSKYGLLCGC